MVVRVIAALILATAMIMGTARASSLVVTGEVATSTPSIISLGAPAAPTVAAPTRSEPLHIDRPARTPSVVALGKALPPVAYENVSAIPKRGPIFQPRIIRGGVSDADAPAAPSPATAASQQTPPPEAAAGNAPSSAAPTSPQ